ncbi:Major facilitator superfamily domain, general substrate transporter [Metarhizium rileyi]|uniref:Major facilitator superfamily domain, general substrate transporter n=1 Tax=Metarhizium rileyi (strain RCEF 4871) TaxID=1649241 RepID=A0A167BNU1_METRR|nr:Major facilitator superfamily domain, general substrate transporter [Metarhizium rileyi RCEF 4871]
MSKPSKAHNDGPNGIVDMTLQKLDLTKKQETSMHSTRPAKSEQADQQLSTPPAYCALTTSRRRFVLGLVSVTGALGPLSGGMYLPVLPLLEREFDASSTSINATISVFMVTFAFAPLCWSSCADLKGRRPLYIMSLAIFMLSNVLLAVMPKNLGALMFLRIVHAFSSAAWLSMGAGTVADTTESNKRGTAMSVFLLGPQCGPVLGPVLGSVLGGRLSWRWIPGFLAILSFVLWVVVLLSLPETLRYRVGNGQAYTGKSWLLFPPKLTSDVAPEALRGPKPPKPTLLGYWGLFSYLPIAILSMNTAMLYSTYFSMMVGLPHILINVYSWSTSEVGAGYVAAGVALMIGSVTGGRVSDWRQSRSSAAPLGPKIEPESRLKDQIWGVFLCVTGVVMFGWVVERSFHVALVLLATFLTGFGMSWVFVTTTTYLTECVPLQAAGAFALGNMLRNPGAATACVLYPSLFCD